MKTKEEIEQLAKEEYKNNLHNPFFTAAPMGYIKGYTQCQEDMADKMNNVMETLLKIRDCKDYGNNSSTLAKELINSLNKQD